LYSAIHRRWGPNFGSKDISPVSSLLRRWGTLQCSSPRGILTCAATTQTSTHQPHQQGIMNESRNRGVPSPEKTLDTEILTLKADSYSIFFNAKGQDRQLAESPMKQRRIDLYSCHEGPRMQPRKATNAAISNTEEVFFLIYDWLYFTRSSNFTSFPPKISSAL
jgi:hypothetical protein